MFHVRINQNKKHFLFDGDNCISKGYDRIYNVGMHFVYFINNPESMFGRSFLFNTLTKSIEKETEGSIYISNKNYIIVSENEDKFIYSRQNLDLLFHIKLVKGDKYNFYFVEDKYYVSANSLFYDQESLVGELNEETAIYNSQLYHVFTLSDKIILKHGVIYFFIDNLDHKIEAIHEKWGFYLLYSKSISSIYYKGERIFKGIIDSHNYNYAVSYIAYFISENKIYLISSISTSLNAVVYTNNIPKIGFEEIFTSPQKIAVLFHQKLLIFESDRFSVSDILQMPLLARIKTNISSHNISQFALCMKVAYIYELSNNESNTIYFFNALSNSIIKSNRKTIAPEISNNLLFYLDCITMSDAHIDLEEEGFTLVDYVYFKNSLSYILEKNGEYTVRNSNDLFKPKSFKKPISFDKNRSIIINTEPGKDKFTFYTLFDNQTSLIKFKYKTEGLDYSKGELLLTNNIDLSHKDLFITDQYPFATEVQ